MIKQLKNLMLSRSFIILLLVMICLLLFVRQFHVITVDGDSMEPTFSNDDRLLGVRTRNIQRGDVIAFSYWNDTFIKRVIGLPGETVNIDDHGKVYIDDVLLEETYVSLLSHGFCEIEFPVVVPENSYFVLGDNRPASNDSRTKSVGFVVMQQIKAKVIYEFE